MYEEITFNYVDGEQEVGQLRLQVQYHRDDASFSYPGYGGGIHQSWQTIFDRITKAEFIVYDECGNVKVHEEWTEDKVLKYVNIDQITDKIDGVP